MDVTLVVETLDQSEGGIPRYNFEISKIREIKNVIEFRKSIKNERLSDKLLNRAYRRKDILEENRRKIGKIVHFTQPEIMPKTHAIDGKKVVLTVHDLAVFGTMRSRNIYSLLRAALFRKQFRYAIRRADTIIVNSNQTKSEIVKILKVDTYKIKVSNLGVDGKFRPIKTQKKDNIIGYFGGFDKRKRVGKLIRDFLSSRLSDRYSLLIYGPENRAYRSLRNRFSSLGSVKFMGKIPEEDMTKTINKFKYFVSATSYEGFGLPLLEAIACGIPTFIYNDAVIPAEVRPLVKTINRLDDITFYSYGAIKKDFMKKSKIVRKRFSWDKTREVTLSVYRHLSSEERDSIG
ncbi:glycosyltransferase [Candidatus Parvarchaeota archaeon]|nr:glycosyltransferase [Candidatus Parvarchaeota archaeon]